jgi:hypothetical protein
MSELDSRPQIEIHASKARLGAASGIAGTLLNSDQIAALQQAITTLVAGFRPPSAPDPAAKTADDSTVRFESLEVELSLKLEVGSGSVIKVVFDAGSEASITAKVIWSRPK